MTSPSAIIKPTAIPRAGYDYQDLVGIDLLLRFFRDPDMFEWVTLESDDPEARSLDDIVALRCDGAVELIQVKFTVDDTRYPLDWAWLLAKSKRGTSLLAKWSAAYVRAKAIGPVHSASLRTNRIPSPEFAACLRDDRIQPDLLEAGLRVRVFDECGGEEKARRFLDAFTFNGGLPNLGHLEVQLRDTVVPTDTDLGGWNLLRSHVRRWATFSGEPSPDGRIRHEHLVQLLSRKRPKPIRQDFHVPEGYAPPSLTFDRGFVKRVIEGQAPLTVLWGTPGRGKSTYLSYLADALAPMGLVIRHHYFLSLRESTSDRTSFFDIANSLLHQIMAKEPMLSRDISGEVPNLRADLALVAGALAAKGQQLFLIVDGLDHVWRDTHRTDQLEHLFNVLLPLPDNVSLIVGTQRVDDAQLPKKLLAQGRSSDWIEIPAMDQTAVHRWIVRQDEARPFLLQRGHHVDRNEEVALIAEAFWGVSKGHPLHLIYAMESLRLQEIPIGVEAVEAIPPCPDGDIRDYYNSLWVTLPADAKRILHALAGSRFAWPSRGIRRCFGDFTAVEFLLEARPSGLMPFHDSVFAWVREREDHADVIDSLLPDIVSWLRSDAPPAWRWAWLWITEARAGNANALLTGVTRDWAVTSLAQGWPEDQIEEIFREAEQISFNRSELARTIAMRSVKTRVSNARAYQASDYALFRATAISIANNHQAARDLLDGLPALDDKDLPWLARLAPSHGRRDMIGACVEELARRISAWIALRHRPDQDFFKLADAYVACALLQGETALPRIMHFLDGFRDPGPRLDRLIKGLGEQADFASLVTLRSKMRAPRLHSQRRRIDEELVRAALRLGRDPTTVLSRNTRTLSPLVAAWRRLRGSGKPDDVAEPPIPEDLLREHYYGQSAAQLEQFFVDAFWLYVCRSETGSGPVTVYPLLNRTAMGWMAEALAALENAASSIIANGGGYGFPTLYEMAGILRPVRFSNATERDHSFYIAFKRALVRIAIDLHLIGKAGLSDKRIPLADFEVARGSLHWSDSSWISDRVADGLVLLGPDSANAIVDARANSSDTRITEFMQRAADWCELARFAQLHNVGDPTALIRRSADCLLGYGYRKDLSAMDMLDAIAQVHQHDPARTRQWLYAVAPVIDVITEFTDGDETDHVRSDLIDTVAATLPELLPAFHRHHMADEDWRYADECLRAFLKKADLGGSHTAALASTLVDAGSLRVLQERGVGDPAAEALHAQQLDFLGGAPLAPEKRADPKHESEKRGKRVNVGRYSPKQLAAMLAAAKGPSVPFDEQRVALRRWLEHWTAKGRAVEALTAIEAELDTLESGLAFEDALDTAFHISLATEGKDAAFRWLVRAHIYRHGWASYWTSEGEVMKRLREASTLYPERWIEFIKETAAQPPYRTRRGLGLVIGQKYLVRFLLLVGEVQRASAVTDALVTSLVEEVQDQPIPPASWLP